jgi:dihydroorotase
MSDETFDLLLKGGTVVNQDGTGPRDIGVRDRRIVAIGPLGDAKAAETVDCSGLHVLPGVIDSQVHFREPGMTHKEDLESGSRAAVKGGVTAVFEMPTTVPPTTDPAALAHKLDRAGNRMFCDHAFWVGGTEENAETLTELERLPGAAGVKVFMGSSTGTLLVPDDGGVAKVLAAIRRRAAFHSEDERMLRERREEAKLGDVSTHPVWRNAETAMHSTERLVHLARAAGKRIHLLHVSTAQEMAYIRDHKDVASVEATPQHLTLAAPEAYERLGTHAQMNPPIRSAEHRAGLWEGIRNGTVDVLGSDHAPHTLEEKAQPYPKSPAGMPGVQTLVPLMLDHVSKGALTLERFVDLVCHGPQRLFGIVGKGRIAAGYDADFTLVDLKAKRTIETEWLESRAGWSPFEGMTVTGWPIATIIRGRTVMRDDEILGAAHGQAVRFSETLQPEQ